MSRIVYVSWPANEITGGIKMTFRHVEALREAGYDACVATSDAKPPVWFDTDAPVIPPIELIPQHDVLVFPENHLKVLEGYAPWPNRKVVFCQSQYMIYRGLQMRPDYRVYGVDSIICPGQVPAAFCRRRCPSQAIYVVPNSIDRTQFRGAEAKRLRIAFAPRKRPQEAGIIQDLFVSANPEFRSVPWVVLSGLSEAEMARALGESALYLSLARFEALSLSMLEAMAAGCIVAGFTGFGGREYATSGNGFWAGEDDCIDAADQLAHAARLYTEGGDRLRAMLAAASDTVDDYSPERFKARLIECWRNILASGA